MKPQIEYSFENLHRQSINAMIRAAYGFIVPDQSERQQWLRFPRTNRHASLRDLEFKKPCHVSPPISGTRSGLRVVVCTCFHCSRARNGRLPTRQNPRAAQFELSI